MRNRISKKKYELVYGTEKRKPYTYGYSIDGYFNKKYGLPLSEMQEEGYDEKLFSLREKTIADLMISLFEPSENLRNVVAEIQENLTDLIIKIKHKERMGNILNYIINVYEIHQEDEKVIREFINNPRKGYFYFFYEDNNLFNDIPVDYYISGNQLKVSAFLKVLNSFLSERKNYNLECITFTEKKNEITQYKKENKDVMRYPANLSPEYFYDHFCDNDLEQKNILKQALEGDFAGELKVLFRKKDSQEFQNWYLNIIEIKYVNIDNVLEDMYKDLDIINKDKNSYFVEFSFEIDYTKVKE